MRAEKETPITVGVTAENKTAEGNRTSTRISQNKLATGLEERIQTAQLESTIIRRPYSTQGGGGKRSKKSVVPV